MHQLIRYLIEELHFKFVLLGKFQTDCLEYRFAQYRRMSGTTFHVSVREIIESEKKLKLMSILSLNSASFGHVSIAQFSADCDAECASSLPNVNLISQPFQAVITEAESVTVTDSDMRVLVFIAGYIGRKVKLAIACSLCTRDLVSKDLMSCDIQLSHLIYIEALDRGGLMWPSQILVDIVAKVYMIFQVLLSEHYEKKFVSLPHHKEIAIHLCVDAIRPEIACDSVCECSRSSIDVYRQCIARMCNILLNNYCKKLNDNAAVDKAVKSKKQRKLTTFKK